MDLDSENEDNEPP